MMDIEIRYQEPVSKPIATVECTLSGPSHYDNGILELEALGSSVVQLFIKDADEEMAVVHLTKSDLGTLVDLMNTLRNQLKS